MIEIEVEDEAWTRALPQVAAIAEQAALAALAAAEGADGEIAILLTGDGAVRDLNARFRGRDAATNVLSFPAPATAGRQLGDIALAFGVCAAEAREQGKPLAHHLSHLVIHGVLHLLGYDHQAEGEAERMEALERTLLAGMNIADPYQTHAQGPVRGDHVQHRP